MTQTTETAGGAFRSALAAEQAQKAVEKRKAQNGEVKRLRAELSRLVSEEIQVWLENFNAGMRRYEGNPQEHELPKAKTEWKIQLEVTELNTKWIDDTVSQDGKCLRVSPLDAIRDLNNLGRRYGVLITLTLKNCNDGGRALCVKIEGDKEFKEIERIIDRTHLSNLR